MLLNIFILVSLFVLIDNLQKKIHNPNHLFPKLCRNIVSHKSLGDFKLYFYNYEIKPNYNINDRCNTIISEKLLTVQKSHDIKELREIEDILLSKQKSVLKEINYLRKNYYNVLFTDISLNPISKYIILDNVSLDKLKKRYDSLTQLNKDINSRKYNLYESFEYSSSFKSLQTYILENRYTILNDYLKQNNIYKLKKDLILLMILLPFIFITYSLMKTYKKRKQYIYFLISKTIVLTLFIPIFLTFIFICSSLVPQNFVNSILELNFPFYVYYVALLLSILLLGLIVTRLQIKYQNDIMNFKKESISRMDSYYKNVCNVCITPVDYESMTHCPTCENELKIECPSCHRHTIKDLNFCVHCGTNIKQKQLFTINEF